MFESIGNAIMLIVVVILMCFGIIAFSEKKDKKDNK